MPQKVLSYDLNLVGLEKIYAFGSRLESTTQVLVTGHDLFYIRESPENNFDLLQESFNYSLMFMVIGGLAVGIFALKAYVKGKEATQRFLMA